MGKSTSGSEGMTSFEGAHLRAREERSASALAPELLLAPRRHRDVYSRKLESRRGWWLERRGGIGGRGRVEGGEGRSGGVGGDGSGRLGRESDGGKAVREGELAIVCDRLKAEVHARSEASLGNEEGSELRLGDKLGLGVLPPEVTLVVKVLGDCRRDRRSALLPCSSRRLQLVPAGEAKQAQLNGLSRSVTHHH